MANYRKYFIADIRKNLPGRLDSIIAGVDSQSKIISANSSFAASSHNPIDKRLDFCAFYLALIKTLDEQGETFETIRKICLEIVTEYVRPKNKL